MFSFLKRGTKIFFYFFVFIFFLIATFFIFNKKNVDNFAEIKINNVELRVELAQDSAKHYLGLSNRETLEGISGMLFLFSDKQERTFVMRDMLISLDIVFIDENTIIDVYKNLPFDKKSQEILYQSSVPIDKVLELEAGLFDYYNFQVGDKIEILKD
ncbi:MAG TPA: DUF192 domain-containing protein [bacterium]|nr:DUF192 domain-containing protein [bacterium]